MAPYEFLLARHLVHYEEHKIAYNCGFKEPADFSKFFRKHMNISPSQFIGHI